MYRVWEVSQYLYSSHQIATSTTEVTVVIDKVDCKQSCYTSSCNEVGPCRSRYPGRMLSVVSAHTGEIGLLSGVGFSGSRLGTKGIVPKDNRVGKGCRGEKSESLHPVGVVGGDEV